MTQPAIQVGDHDPEPRQFYYGTGFAVGEIEISLNDLTRKVHDLQQGNEIGSAVQQKLAAESISKIAEQIKILADTISRVTIAHINRRPRA